MKKRIKLPGAQNLPLRRVLQNHCAKSVQIRSISPYSARMQENMDQKQLPIRTLFTQWIVFFQYFLENSFNTLHIKSSILSKNQIFRTPLYKSTSRGLLLMFYFSSVFLWCSYSMTVVVWYSNVVFLSFSMYLMHSLSYVDQTVRSESILSINCATIQESLQNYFKLKKPKL